MDVRAAKRNVDMDEVITRRVLEQVLEEKLDERIDKFSKDFKGYIDLLRKDMDARFDILTETVGSIRVEMTSVKQILHSHSKQLIEVDFRLSKLESRS